MGDHSYKASLVAMMNYLDRPTPVYTIDTIFTQEQLGALTAADVMKFFNFRTYGVEDPPHGHNLVPQVRCNSLKYWKKAISHYMPNRLMAWNSVTNTAGNPTRSNELNQLLSKVTRDETRGRGVQSQARRATTTDEFEAIHLILKNEGVGIEEKYGIPAMLNFQYHLIARIDDTCMAFLGNLKAHDGFDFVLKGKLNWSKNVREERDAPFQHIFASQDPRFCVHLSMGVWLETYFVASPQGNLTPYIFTFADDVEIPSGSKKSSKLVQRIFKDKIAAHEAFAHTLGKLGTHSIRKFASTASRRRGISKDHKDLRGRWKSSKRISDVYDEVELPYPDAKVAAALCPGGVIKYKLKDGANVTAEFILNHIVPKSAERLGNDVALILGKAVLWGAFAQVGNNNEHIMPNEKALQVRQAYGIYIENNLPAGTNPVDTIPVVVTGHEGEVYIDEINLDPLVLNDEEEDHGGHRAVTNNMDARAGGTFADRPVREQLLAMHSQMMQLRRGQEILRETLQNNQLQTTRILQNLTSNTRRLAAAPARRLPEANNNNGEGAAGGGAGGGGGIIVNNQQAASLSPTPRCLYTLWAEYNEGLGGRKAARLFTAEERGRAKHKYTRRKVVWDTIDRMIRRGLSAQVAIDRIYNHYGRNHSVTRIINGMLQDRRANSIPVVFL